jgi:hypothetical protein
MTDREKLIELLITAKDIITLGKQADFLIANGVTFATDTNVPSKWISVKDRLPDDSIPSTFYLCYWNGYIRVCKYWRTRKVFEHRGKTVKVTHWMPLPEPPKGE